MDFFDRQGFPVAYSDEQGHLFSFQGLALGYLDGDSVFNFQGRHIGWHAHGWIWDHSGCAVLFSNSAAPLGPMLPLKRNLPLRSAKHLPPFRGLQQQKPLKVPFSTLWSTRDQRSFFVA
jgi:hypothetical protein